MDVSTSLYIKVNGTALVTIKPEVLVLKRM